MKPFILIFLMGIILSSCAYNSTILKTGKGSNSEIKFSKVTDSINLDNDGIFGLEQSLIRLNQTKGSKNEVVHLFLVNDNVFLESRIKRYSEDSIKLLGVIRDKKRNDDLEFEIDLFVGNLTHNLNQISKSHYIVNLLSTGEQKNLVISESAKTFEILNSKNYTIQKKILELLTGEIKTRNNSTKKFIILNDTESPTVYLTSIFILDNLASHEIKDLEKECEKNPDITCNKNEYKITDCGLEFFLNIKICCVCKKNQ